MPRRRKWKWCAEFASASRRIHSIIIRVNEVGGSGVYLIRGVKLVCSTVVLSVPFILDFSLSLFLRTVFIHTEILIGCRRLFS
jgi:hypothetical protein